MTQQVYIQTQPLIQQQPIQVIQPQQTPYIQTQVRPVQYVPTQPIIMQQQQPLIIQSQPIQVMTAPIKPKSVHVTAQVKHHHKKAEMKPQLSNTNSKYAKYKQYYIEHEKKLKKYTKKKHYKENKLNCFEVTMGIICFLCFFGVFFSIDIAALVMSYKYKNDVCTSYSNTSVGLSPFEIMVPGSIVNMVVFVLALLCIVRNEPPWILIFGNIYVVIWATLGLNLYWNNGYYNICSDHPISYMLQTWCWWKWISIVCGGIGHLGRYNIVYY